MTTRRSPDCRGEQRRSASRRAGPAWPPRGPARHARRQHRQRGPGGDRRSGCHRRPGQAAAGHSSSWVLVRRRRSVGGTPRESSADRPGRLQPAPEGAKLTDLPGLAFGAEANVGTGATSKREGSLEYQGPNSKKTSAARLDAPPPSTAARTEIAGSLGWRTTANRRRFVPSRVRSSTPSVPRCAADLPCNFRGHSRTRCHELTLFVAQE